MGSELKRPFYPGADPGFSVGGGANIQICPMHEIKKILVHKGRARRGHPLLGSATATFCVILSLFYHYFITSSIRRKSNSGFSRKKIILIISFVGQQFCGCINWRIRAVFFKKMPGIIFLVFLPLGLALLRLGNPGIVTEVGQLTQNLGCRDLKRCPRIFGLHKHFGVLMITNSSRSRSEPLLFASDTSGST